MRHWRASPFAVPGPHRADVPETGARPSNNPAQRHFPRHHLSDCPRPRAGAPETGARPSNNPTQTHFPTSIDLWIPVGDPPEDDE